jgi:glycosyltransferase involved in cell wall biosynthesis
MKTLIAFPVYDRAPILLERITAVMDSFADCAFLVIDDASTDGLWDELQTSERLRIIRHEESLGYGGCVMSALTFAAEYEQLILADIAVKGLIPAISALQTTLASADIATATGRRSVATDEEYRAYSPYSALIERIAEAAVVDLIDPFSPFKGIRIDALEGMALEEFDESIIIQLFVQGAHFRRRIAEVFCEDLAGGDAAEAALEHDAERYLDFLDGEKLLYPSPQGDAFSD